MPCDAGWSVVCDTPRLSELLSMLVFVMFMFIENAHVRIAFLSFLLFFCLSVCRSMHTYPIPVYLHTYIRDYILPLLSTPTECTITQCTGINGAEEMSTYHIEYRAWQMHVDDYEEHEGSCQSSTMVKSYICLYFG